MRDNVQAQGKRGSKTLKTLSKGGDHFSSSQGAERGLSWPLLNYRRTSSALCSCTNRKRCSQERCLQTEHAPRCEEGSQRCQSRPEARPVRRSRRRPRTLRAGRGTRGLCSPAIRPARGAAQALAALPPGQHRRRQRRPLPCSSRGERASTAQTMDITQKSSS